MKKHQVQAELHNRCLKQKTVPVYTPHSERTASIAIMGYHFIDYQTRQSLAPSGPGSGWIVRHPGCDHVGMSQRGNLFPFPTC